MDTYQEAMEKKDKMEMAKLQTEIGHLNWVMDEYEGWSGLVARVDLVTGLSGRKERLAVLETVDSGNDE